MATEGEDRSPGQAPHPRRPVSLGDRAYGSSTTLREGLAGQERSPGVGDEVGLLQVRKCGAGSP